MKIDKAIKIASKELNRSEIKSSLLDAEILLSKVINKDRKFIILNSDKEINNQEYEYFKKLIKERLSGKPIAYLTGKKFFWEYEFDISEHVLIPRPDTETIIELVLKFFKYKNYINFLEIGVGSGCILLSILKEKKNFQATGIDISKECIEICGINAKKLRVKNRLKLFKSDIDNFTNGKYDLIISNPPYIKKNIISKLDKDIRNFEPKLALDGGLEGTSVIRKVISKSSELIKKNGKLILEIANNQKQEVKELLKKNGFYIDCVLKDLAKNDRCIISTKI